jgi:hypothetical protein
MPSSASIDDRCEHLHQLPCVTPRLKAEGETKLIDLRTRMLFERLDTRNDVSRQAPEELRAARQSTEQRAARLRRPERSRIDPISQHARTLMRFMERADDAENLHVLFEQSGELPSFFPLAKEFARSLTDQKLRGLPRSTLPAKPARRVALDTTVTHDVSGVRTAAHCRHARQPDALSCFRHFPRLRARSSVDPIADFATIDPYALGGSDADPSRLTVD